MLSKFYNISSKLSVEILSIIFEEFDNEDTLCSLYSCIHVNREWCRTAIPFLWKNPWKCTDEVSFFEFLLTMISKESKEFLKKNGMDFLIEDTSVLQTPLFDYISFCKVIDSCRITSMIYLKIVHLTTENQRYLVEREVLKLLVGKTSKLKILKLRHKSHPIADFPNSSMSLSLLNELHCETSIDETIFDRLSQLCRNIERLVIEGCNNDNHGLNLFIKQQINLKMVKICGDSVFKNLGEALVTKTSSIVELDLGECSAQIVPILLKKFQNNLTLFKFCIFRKPDEEASGLENILRDISLPNLIIYH